MKFDVMPVATERQIEEIEAVAVHAWRECYQGMYPERQLTDMFETLQSKDAMRRLMREGQIYYMLLVDNQFAGYLSFRHNGNHIFLYSLYVKPDFRRKGIGRKSVEQFDKMLSGEEFHHVRKLKLKVPRHYRQAVKILQHLDFRVTKAVDSETIHGYPLNEYVMERKIKRSQAEYGE